MKKLFAIVALTLISVGVNAQLKKDGTPDMRYKANKETYGSSYTRPSTPTYSTPSYEQPKQKSYENGGRIKVQDGYMKSNGTYVAPHLKTTPDNKKYNNYNAY